MIRSSPFGSVVLTGADAAAFQAQVSSGTPPVAAQEAVARGQRLARALREHGSLTFMVEPVISDAR